MTEESSPKVEWKDTVFGISSSVPGQKFKDGLQSSPDVEIKNTDFGSLGLNTRIDSEGVSPSNFNLTITGPNFKKLLTVASPTNKIEEIILNRDVR